MSAVGRGAIRFFDGSDVDVAHQSGRKAERRNSDKPSKS